LLYSSILKMLKFS